MKRRAFMASVGALPLGAAFPFHLAHADGHAAPIPVIEVHKVGQTTVTAISDGFLTIEPGILNGVDEAGFAAALERAHISGKAHPTGVNAFLIESGAEKILIDAGTGAVFGPTLGHMGAHLNALGVAPADITKLVATHLHPDHIGGAMVDGKNPFEKAELVVHEADLGFWTNADVKAQAPENFHAFFDLAAGVTASFGERIKTVAGEADLGHGLTAMPMPGHTPGHMGIMVEDSGDNLLIWGDIVHVPPVQFADPSVTIAFDADQDTARATRAKVLDMVATDGLKVAGAHIEFPGMGYLSKDGSGYRWEPAPYPYG